MNYLFSIRKIILLSVLVLLLSLCFMVIEVSAGVQLIGSMTHQYSLMPDEEFKGTIILNNPDDNLQTVRVYQRDYWFNAKGENFYKETDERPRSNAGWIELGKERVNIPPGKKLIIPYKIKVPDKELTGTYWSAIMVKPVVITNYESKPACKEKKANRYMSIRHNICYAIQIVTNIGRSGKKKLVFRNPVLIRDKNKDSYCFQIDLENTGERWLIPEVWMEIFDQEGEVAGKFRGKQKLRIYPGTSICQKIDLGRLEPGTYPSLFIADNKDDAVFGYRCSLEVK